MPAARSSTSVNRILLNLAANRPFVATDTWDGSPCSAFYGFEIVEVPETSLPEMSHLLIADSSTISKAIVKIERPHPGSPHEIRGINSSRSCTVGERKHPDPGKFAIFAVHIRAKVLLLRND
jgi:hypothetical protein